MTANVTAVTLDAMDDTRPAKTTPAARTARRLSPVLGGASALSQVARDLGTALDRAFSDLDLTAQQAALLMHASTADSSPTQLMARLGTDTAGMTKLIDRLEAKGLVARHRSATDRRSVLIEVSDTGQQLAPRVPIVFGKITRQLFNGFSPEELTALSAMLQRMATNLGRVPG
jgi:DNA-binding MarR family transcriptional regulator